MRKYDVEFEGNEKLAEVAKEFFDMVLCENDDQMLKVEMNVEADDGCVWIYGNVNGQDGYYWDLGDGFDEWEEMPNDKCYVIFTAQNMSRKEELKSFGFDDGCAKYAASLGL